MRIGVFIGSFGPSSGPDDEVRWAVRAEELGLDSVWFPHILGGDALTTIALAGQQTRRIELGTAVVPIYVHHPLALAQQALTTRTATKGRLTLGIGLSHKPTVEKRFGLSFDRPAAHMREYLSVLKDVVETGRVDFTGEFYRVSAELDSVSPGAMPVLLAALGPVMLRMAGETAGGTITWMVGPKTLESHIAPRITRAAEAAGRPRPRICVGLPLAVTDDPDLARGEAAKRFARYDLLPSYRRMMDMEGAEGPADMAIIGTEDEVEDRIRALAAARATDLAAWVFPDRPDSSESVDRAMALLKSLVGQL